MAASKAERKRFFIYIYILSLNLSLDIEEPKFQTFRAATCLENQDDII